MKSTAFSGLRFVFILLIFAFSFQYMLQRGYTSLENVGVSSITAVGLGVFLSLAEMVLRKVSLFSLNTVILGLFLGYLLNKSLQLLFIPLLGPLATPSSPLNIVLHLFSTYFALAVTCRCANKWHVSIPFLSFQEEKVTTAKKFIVSPSALADHRLLDFATQGLFDSRLILPRFVVNAACVQSQSYDESEKKEAQATLDAIKKLEFLSSLDLSWDETQFANSTLSTQEKLIQCARAHKAYLLISSSDSNGAEESQLDSGLRIVNLQALFYALKPTMHPGEELNIKMQRMGKESNQGVGYLDDGSMVVVNGGGEFIGQVIRTRVISVKSTSAGSGRIIFCNVHEEFFGEALPASDQMGEIDVDDHDKSYMHI